MERECYVDIDCTVREFLTDQGYLSGWNDPRESKYVVMIRNKQAYMEQRLTDGETIVMFLAPIGAHESLPDDGGLSADGLSGIFRMWGAASESSRARAISKARKAK
jgi:hypothetical protein